MPEAPRFAPLTLRPRAVPLAIGRPPMLLAVSSLLERPPEIAPEIEPAKPSRRTRIWDLSHHIHCSIIGTCLAAGELRLILIKAGLVVDSASDHELHSKGVQLAAERDKLGKLLNKALDKRHKTAIGRYDKVSSAGQMRALWQADLKGGDIPGGYWAAVTHPAATDDLVRQIFGEVHMLSHMVGAANRADIRRLRDLEIENDRLREKLARQEGHLRDGIASRDGRIRELTGLLARHIAEGNRDGDADEQSADRKALEGLIADLERRLQLEASRRAGAEERTARAQEDVLRERSRSQDLERREAALREELDAVETRFGARGQEDEADALPRLRGRSLLYVGGRTDKLGHLKAVAEGCGGQFLHHDGGVDDRSGLIAGLVSRADLVVFPVDCVSHEAVILVKRLCRQMSKPYLPLRSTGLGSFVSALAKAPIGGLA